MSEWLGSDWLSTDSLLSSRLLEVSCRNRRHSRCTSSESALLTFLAVTQTCSQSYIDFLCSEGFCAAYQIRFSCIDRTSVCMEKQKIHINDVRRPTALASVMIHTRRAVIGCHHWLSFVALWTVVCRRVCVYLYMLHTEDRFHNIYQPKQVICGKWGPVFSVLTFFVCFTLWHHRFEGPKCIFHYRLLHVRLKNWGRIFLPITWFISCFLLAFHKIWQRWSVGADWTHLGTAYLHTARTGSNARTN